MDDEQGWKHVRYVLLVTVGCFWPSDKYDCLTQAVDMPRITSELLI